MPIPPEANHPTPTPTDRIPVADRAILSPEGAVALGYFSSVQAAASLRCRCQGPRYAKVGRKVVYRRADLDAWLAANLCETSDHSKPRDEWLARLRRTHRRSGGRP